MLIGRLRLAAACLRDFFQWAEKRKESDLISPSKRQSFASSESTDINFSIEALLDRVCGTIREFPADASRRIACSLVFTELLASSLK